MSKQLEAISFYTPVQALIPKVEERMRLSAEEHHAELGNALEHLLSSGGKRVRVAVTLLSGIMLGASEQRLITLAAAIELLHTATLVHDDLIDGSLLRRGIATLNSQWSPAATVLTGDFIFAQAAKLAAETDSVSVMRVFASTLATIVNGEITQMFSVQGSTNRKEYLNRIYAKTASMFELAAESAAILSMTNQDVIRQMKTFGYEIGMAFQIVDDVLDFTGEQLSLGKPVASDLRNGLITLPAICYLELHPDDPDVQFIRFGLPASDAQIDQMMAKIRQTGAIELALDEARSHIRRAEEIMEMMPEGEERQALLELSDYIVNRNQ